MLEAKMEEVLQYMILSLQEEAEKAEEERREIWYHHLSRVYAQPAQEKEPHGLKQGRKAFIEAFSDKEPKQVDSNKPRTEPKQEKKQAKKYEWDFDMLRQLKAEQEQKRKAKAKRKGGA